MNDFITVYSAETMRRLRSRIFVVGVLVGALGIGLIIKLPTYMDSLSNQANRVALAGDPALVSQARPLLRKDFQVVRTMPGKTSVSASDLTDAKKISAIILLRRSGHTMNVAVYARDPGNITVSALRRDLLPISLQISTGLTRTDVAKAMKLPVTVHATNSKFGSAAQANDARIIAYIMLFALYILIMINSQLIMSSVAEEKTSRIAEMLVASVNPSALLSGKIAASATLAVLQMIIWIAIGFILGAHPGPPAALASADTSRASFSFSLSNVSSADITGFAAFFLLGYLQVSTMFAAVGSLVNRTEDLGALAGPLVIPVVAAFLIAMTALAAPNTPVVIITSFVPLIAPFVMFARIVVSDVPLWQVLLSLAINIAATYAIAVLAGKIYRVGMLLYGRPPKLSQIWSVIRS
jgi:ABC-2 type transport system permease protein